MHNWGQLPRSENETPWVQCSDGRKRTLEAQERLKSLARQPPEARDDLEGDALAEDLVEPGRTCAQSGEGVADEGRVVFAGGPEGLPEEAELAGLEEGTEGLEELCGLSLAVGLGGGAVEGLAVFVFVVRSRGWGREGPADDERVGEKGPGEGKVGGEGGVGEGEEEGREHGGW